MLSRFNPATFQEEIYAYPRARDPQPPDPPRIRGRRRRAQGVIPPTVCNFRSDYNICLNQDKDALPIPLPAPLPIPVPLPPPLPVPLPVSSQPEDNVEMGELPDQEEEQDIVRFEEDSDEQIREWLPGRAVIPTSVIPTPVYGLG